MRINRLLLLLVFALPFLIVPVSAHAGVYIGVSIAPPVLPDYAQPMCPEAGWMWIPGYWAYDYDSGGYYWVPGTWTPAPYMGALWTPGYWGWETGLYYWHSGYWGRHIGYYGGVNYGYGYFGIGFLGGYWRDRDFYYNRAYMRIGDGYRNSYDDRRGFDSHTVQRDSRTAFNGGPGGINHRPGADERVAERDRHTQPTSFQNQHIEAARQDRSSYFNSNNGRPGNAAVSRPLAPSRPSSPAGGNNMRSNPAPVNRGEINRPGSQQSQSQPNRPQYNNPAPGGGQSQQRSQPGYSQAPSGGQSQQRSQPGNTPAPGNGQMQQRSQPGNSQAPQMSPSRPQSSPSAAPRSQPQSQPQMRQSAPSMPSRSQPSSGGGGQMQQRSQPSSGGGSQQRGGGSSGPRGR